MARLRGWYSCERSGALVEELAVLRGKKEWLSAPGVTRAGVTKEHGSPHTCLQSWAWPSDWGGSPPHLRLQHGQALSLVRILLHPAASVSTSLRWARPPTPTLLPRTGVPGCALRTGVVGTCWVCLCAGRMCVCLCVWMGHLCTDRLPSVRTGSVCLDE